MVLSIVLIHAVAAHFGLQLKYKSLALCAVSSIGISLAALRTSTFIDKIFFVKIAGMILLASLIATALNRVTVKPAVEHESDQPVEQREEPIDEPIVSRRATAREVDVVKRRVAELKAQKVSGRPTFDAAQAQSIVQRIAEDKKLVPASDKKISSPSERKPSVIEQKISVSGEPIIKPKRPTVTEKKAAHLATANEKISAAIDKSKSEKKSVKPADKPVEEATDKSATVKRKAIEFGITEEDIGAVEEHLISLDNILEFAADNKNAGNFKLAIYCYRRALERYREDDYAPFIAIDLSSIYKEQAAYFKAIKVCEEALKLPAVVRSDNARKECASNLAYLRTVQSVLAKHRVLSTPFSKISRQLRAEIDAEFKKQTVFSGV